MNLAIIDPRASWCAALAGRLIESGFESIRRWSGISEALPALLAAPPEILLLSSLSARHVSDAEMLSLKKRTRLVLVVDHRDTLAAGDLPAIGVDAILASDASSASIAECLRFVTAGRAWLDARLFQFGQRPPHIWNSLSVREQQVAKERMDDYVRDVAGSGGAAAEIEKAKTLLDSGAITADEYASLKAKALAGGAA